MHHGTTYSKGGTMIFNDYGGTGCTGRPYSAETDMFPGVKVGALAT